MFRKILVPLDGSRQAEECLPYVKRLVEIFGSRIYFFQAVPSHFAAPGSTRSAVKIAESYLEEAGARWKKYVPKISVRLSEGDAHAEIIDCARGEKVGLIAMTTRGVSGIERWMLGSVAAKVLRASPVATLVVRSRNLSRQGFLRFIDEVSDWPRHILVPLDGSPTAERVFAPLKKILATIDANVSFLRVVASPKERSSAKAYLEKTAEKLQKSGITTGRIITTQGDPAEEILNVLEEHTSVDFLAMTTHGRSGFNRLFFGSVAEKVLSHAAVPVLLVRARKT